jgi:5'-nucleotidase
MTMRDPLRVKSGEIDGIEALEVNGLPVDCVNVGLTVAWPDGCDLVLSGINNGPNLGFDVTYSGTVGAAMEGAINGIKSVALSMCVFAEGAPFHYETGAAWLRENWDMLLSLPTHELTVLNVNVPAIAFPEINGHKFVGMGRRIYEDRVERREDPWGRPYYWQGGNVVMRPDAVDTDVWAVSNGYVAITPVSLDWTDHALLTEYTGADRVIRGDSVFSGPGRGQVTNSD